MNSGTPHDAFVRLYHETYDSLLKYVVSRCSDADEVPDIMQRTYISYYERIQKHNDIDSPQDYLFIIARNELKKYYKQKAMQRQSIPVFSQMEGEDFEAIEAMLSQDLPETIDLDTRAMWDFIKSRDALTCQIFILYFYYDQTLAKIAKDLNVGESTVKNRLYRTLSQMRERFKIP